MRASERPRIRVKRAYEAPAKSDGCRVLVDRVWPRGVTRDALRLDAWIKDVAPSAGLRKWFAHDPSRWDAFKKRYFGELDARPEAIALLLETCRRGTVTLVFGAKDIEHNNAVALQEYLARAPE
jgi:uncharacterized protein YeaO (DUF488 family)